MGRFIFRRLLFLLPVLFIVSLISFSLMYLAPGDPAQIFLAQSGSAPSAEAVAALRAELGLDRPAAVQYLDWIGSALRGDLGTSIATGEPVSAEIARYFPDTLRLALLALVLTFCIAVPLGVLAAVRENRLCDRLIRGWAFFAGSLPGFFAGLMLIYLFGVRLRWLPTISSGSPLGIIIPALTLALTLSAPYIRQVRAAVIYELGRGYIRMARARGVRESAILLCGALRSALPALLAVAGTTAGQLLGGTAIIEMVCSYPGLGRVAVDAVRNLDYPLVQGYVLLMAGVYVLINLLVDILQALADPRLRTQAAGVREGGGVS